jgi:hypothetical protein
MVNKIFLLSIIFYSIGVFSQKNLSKGYVVLETNDTIFGKLKDKNFSAANGVRLYDETSSVRYPKRKLSEIHIDSIQYVKSESGWLKAFFRKDLSGNVNLYTFGKKKVLGRFDSDINICRLRSSIKLYCSDFPNLKDSIKDISNENVDDFIVKYNNWKTKNPESKSFFEKNMHYKPLINFKTSFLLPGAGFEIGLGEKFSFSAMLKNEFGYSAIAGWKLNPFIDTQIRYFHDNDKRTAENKRTYKYSGNYICVVDGYFVNNKSNFLGIEYGWQRIISKHWYSIVGIGAAKWTTGNQGFAFLCDIDFGYNF